MSASIPDDAKDRALFLYHPTLPGSKRVDITNKNPNRQQELDQFKREGWTEQRFAKMFYHAKFPAKVVTNPKDVPTLKRQGWSEEPVKGASVHESNVHPHAADEHRIAFLEASTQETEGE